jgi:hypothetical protein
MVLPERNAILEPRQAPEAVPISELINRIPAGERPRIVWEVIKRDYLKARLGPDSRIQKTYGRSFVVASVTPICIDDGWLRVTVPNEQTLTWIESEYAGLVDEILREVAPALCGVVFYVANKRGARQRDMRAYSAHDRASGQGAHMTPATGIRALRFRPALLRSAPDEGQQNGSPGGNTGSASATAARSLGPCASSVAPIPARSREVQRLWPSCYSSVDFRFRRQGDQGVVETWRTTPRTGKPESRYRPNGRGHSARAGEKLQTTWRTRP